MAHAGLFGVRRRALRLELSRERFHSLTNFDQPHAHCVEHQWVAEVTAAHVVSDGIYGGQNVV